MTVVKSAALRLVTVTALAMVLVVAPADIGWVQAKPSDNDTANLYEDALARFSNNDITGAIIQLKNVLQQNPSNLPARILIGRAHLALGDAESAEKELRRAQVEGGDEELLIVPLANATYLLERYDDVLTKFPAEGRSRDVEMDLRVVHGQAFLGLLKVEEAEEAFERAATLRPDAVTPIIGLARVYLARSELHAAAKLSKRAIRASPDNFYAWNINGKIARRAGKATVALQSFSKTIELAPNFIPARIARAMILIEQGRHEEVGDDIAVISENEPHNPFGSYIGALLKLRRGDKAGFQTALQKTNTQLRGLERGELLNSPPKLLLAGIVNLALGNYNDAFNFMREHVQRDRFHAGSRSVLGRLLMRQGKNLDALTHLQVAAKLAPNDAEIWRLLGVAYTRNQRADEASAAFNKAIELKPRASSLRTVLAMSQLRSGKRKEAVAGLENALASNPDAVRPGILLALILIRDGEFDAAMQVAERVLKRDPDNPTPHNLIASAHWGKGDLNDARKSLQSAIALSPNYLPAHRNLARIDLESGDVEAAKSRLRLMLEMPNAGVQPLSELAAIAGREGQFREGASLLSKARERAPENLRIQLDLIDMLSRLGDGDAALRNARKLRDQHIDNSAVLEKMGQIELAFGKREDAAKTFRRMAEFIHDDAERLLRAARYQLRAQDLENAYETLKRALISNESHLEVLEEIINLEGRLGRFEDAQFRTAQLIKRFPKIALGEGLRGDTLVRMRRYGEAALAYQAAIRKQPSGTLHVRHYLARRNAGIEAPSLAALERWVETNPKDYATRRALASGYLYAKNDSAARQLYEALNLERPNDPMVLNNLAGLYLDAGDPRTLDLAAAAHRLAPRQPQTLDTLGWVHVRQGRTKQGLELLRDAFSRVSRDATIRYHLAVALSRLGQNAEARTHLQDLLKSKVTDDVALDAKRLLNELGGG